MMRGNGVAVIHEFENENDVCVPVCVEHVENEGVSQPFGKK